jgi:hypothetical protein
MNSPQQEQQIELTKNQHNPYLARPEDFTVTTLDQIASRTQPFHFTASAAIAIAKMQRYSLNVRRRGKVRILVQRR